MAHNNNPSDLNRSLRDTGEESSPSPPRQSQRRRLTGSQWTGGDNQALQYLSGVAAQGFTDGWNDRGPALPRETDDAQHYPTAGPGLQPLDEGVNLYSPSGHLDSRLGQAPLTDYGGYVPDPSSLAPDPGRTRDFSSTDSLARYTGQQSLWSYPIAGPSGGGENFDDTPLPENIGPPLERTSHTDYRGYVSDPYGLADDSYRTGGVPSLGSTEFGAPQSFDTDAARSVGPSLSQTESLYSNELNPDATHLSDFGSSQGRKRKRTGEGLSTRHGDPSAFSSWDLLDNASQNTRSVSSRTTNLTTWSLQERLGDVALQDSLHGPQTQQHNLDSEIKRLALELKGQVSSIEGWSWSSSEQRKSLLQGLSPEQKKPLLERIDALDPKVTQWVNHCEMKKRALNNALSRDRGKLRELAQQCRQAEDEKQEAESARNLLASRPMGHYVRFEDQIQEYDEEITRLDTNVENANNQYNNKKQELDPLIKSNDAEKRRYNNEATMWNSFLKYMRKTLKEDLQVSPLSAQGTQSEADSQDIDQQPIAPRGKAPVREQMEQPPRADYTNEQLNDDIEVFVQKLAGDPTQELEDIITVQKWRAPGKELRQNEVDAVKRIAVALRESKQLDDRVTGKNSKQLCTTIQNAAARSNPEYKAKQHELYVARRAKTEFKVDKAAYEAARRAKTEFKVDKAAYQAAWHAKKADEEAARLETHLSLGPLAIGNLEENAQSVKEEEQVLSFPEEPS